MYEKEDIQEAFLEQELDPKMSTISFHK